MGRQRVLDCVRGFPVDHPVAAPYMGNYAIGCSGRHPATCQKDALLMAKAQLETWKRLHQEVIVVQSDNYYMAEAFGAPVIHQENRMPVLAGSAIACEEDIWRLEPVDPRKSGRMPVYIEAIGRISHSVGQQAAVRGCGTGPFVLGGHVLGIERLLLWMAETDGGIQDHGEALRYLFSVGLETLVAFATAQLENGATIVQLADSLASLQVISPQMYRTYVFPYEREFFSRIHPVCQKHDAVALLHICGNNTQVFEDYVDSGADIIAVDHAASLAEAARIVGNRCCIIGNINPSGVLLWGKPEEVASQAHECFEAVLPNRYLLGTGCEVAMDTPLDNIKALLAVTENPTGGPL
ncbi:MAG: uroporphyrinogen decarboxylase family protein [Sphaerochaetaceae bacterium]